MNTRHVYGAINVEVPVETYNEVLDRQGYKCSITDKQITPHRPGVLIRIDPSLPLDEDNLALIAKFLLDTPDALSYSLLQQQWATRPRQRKNKTVAAIRSDLPF
jgi:hypothetical protein